MSSSIEFEFEFGLVWLSQRFPAFSFAVCSCSFDIFLFASQDEILQGNAMNTPGNTPFRGVLLFRTAGFELKVELELVVRTQTHAIKVELELRY